MTSSLALLAQPHSAAARTMVEEVLIPGVDVSNLLVGVSEVRPDGDADLPVYIDSDAYNDPAWPYRGSVTLRYKRLDLALLSAIGDLRCYVGPIYIADAVVARLSEVLQLQFESTDYVHESFPLTTAGRVVTLKASEDSPRWKGQVDVFVYR